MLVYLRTTLKINDNDLEKAFCLTGIKELTTLVRLDSDNLAGHEGSKPLAKLGGSEEDLRPIP